MAQTPIDPADMTDEAISAMTKHATEAALRLEVALNEVRPIIGEIYNCTSAEEAYAYCLTECGVDIEGVDPAAYRAMVRLLDTDGKLKTAQASDRALAAPSSISKALERIKH